MARIPIRLKLTLVFALVMALVLAGTGLFIYYAIRSDLDHTVDQGLRSRADDVTALIRQTGGASGLARTGGAALVEQGESFTQIVDSRGRIVESTPPFSRRRLLAPAELLRARSATLLVDRPPLPGLKDPSRLLATPVSAGGRRLVVVVGSALDDRNDALRSLRRRLLIGGPIALLLASLAGYGIAAAALRPVEAMRRRASLVSAEGRGQRLPVPPAQDELHRLGETLNEMIARLEAAFERERTFVADASHELRTPLAILRTELELALRQGRTEAELRESLRSASEEADRLSALAEDLLVIARSDQGELPVRPETVAIDDLFERVTRVLPAGAPAIRVEDAGGLSLSADPLRLEQALRNLADNALRHGGGDVTISARRHGDAVEIHVTDEGPGFPPGFAERAFERFTRADPARGRGGAGLGLAIVAAVAHAHGGSVHATNRPEGGADVSLSLPSSEPHPAPVQTGLRSEPGGRA